MESTAAIHRPTTSSLLAERLREEIYAGELAPGARLRQLEVARRFGVSSTPVREAFAALEREGLLRGVPHRGVEVFRPTVADLEDIHEIRTPLEALAAERAVSRLTDDDLASMRRQLDVMAGAPGDGRSGGLCHEFHATIYRAAESPRLERLLNDLRDASSAYIALFASVSDDLNEMHGEHVRILEACEARDPHEAAAAVVEHLQKIVERIRAALSTPDDPPASSSDNGIRSSS
jgi:DNA-binding GntR family transcriptional regulator